MESGYIKLWRKLKDSGLFRSHKTLALWIWILIHAAYKEKKVVLGNETITIYPGQYITGRKTLAAELHVHESVIRRSLTRLKTDQQITIKTTNKYSIITVCNWDIYQSRESYIDHQNDQHFDQRMTNRRPTDDQRMTTTKEVKKERNTSIESSTDNKQCIAPSFDRGKAWFNPKHKECTEQAKHVIDYFNAVTGKHAQYKGDGFNKIVKLLMENEPIDSLKYVIDTKMHDPDFNRWMTPRTLFGDKFYDYQAEDIKDYQQDAPKVKTTVTPREEFLNDPYSDLIEFDGGYKERQEDGTMKTFYYENEDGGE